MLAALFGTPQIHTGEDRVHRDPADRESVAVTVDGELIYQPATDDPSDTRGLR